MTAALFGFLSEDVWAARVLGSSATSEFVRFDSSYSRGGGAPAVWCVDFSDISAAGKF